MPRQGRFYTGTRRIPNTFNRMPSGERIWGGPYTLVQVAAGALTLALMFATSRAWSDGSTLSTVLISAVAAYAVTYLLRFAPENLHELGINASGAVQAPFRSRAGTYQGRPVRIRHRKAPHYPRTPIPEQIEPQAPSPGFGPVPSSSVQRLLQRGR